MGYLSIENLYRPRAQQILAFKQLFALEKIHGTSSHLKWQKKDDAGCLTFFSGGENYGKFIALFDQEALTAKLTELFGIPEEPVIIFGEAYGGKQQKMSATYGPDLKFVAFDVQVGSNWLNVERADYIVRQLGLEFVDYVLIDSTLEAIDAQRDRPSTQAARNGITEPKIREGVVLRPPFEVTLNNGQRLITKHKRDEFKEIGAPTVSVDPGKADLAMRMKAIAEQWATPMRFEHVVDQLIRNRDEKQVDMKDIPDLIKLMCADILREGEGEVVITDEKAFNKSVGALVVKMLKAQLAGVLV